jgi:selenocysteine lyase/cysteine desulfurase
MSVDRRQFLLSTPAVAAAGRWTLAPGQAGPPPLGRAHRELFPRTSAETYLNSAAQHPLGRHVLAAMGRHLDYEVHGAGEGRAYFSRADQAELKTQFGALINATADEIAFVQSTSDGENVVVAGLDLAGRGGNVVVDDLHFITSLYMYKSLEAQGLELRVVQHRGGAIDRDDLARAIDDDTRLVSVALVSNINGYREDMRAIVYADMIQAVGAVPLDMRALGIDFAAASTYKWLMAERGFGLLYVRAELQEQVVPTTRWGHRQIQRFDRAAWTWDVLPGAARYETGNISEPLAAAALASIRHLHTLGVDRIAAHAARLVARLQAELPAAGYASLTPADNQSPVVAFALPDPEDTIRRVQAAGIAVTIAPAEQRMRVSVSVFNDDDDVDRLVRALA